MSTIEIRVPDLGNHSNVEVVELMARQGEAVVAGQVLFTIESSKASMEIASSHSGVIRDIMVGTGDVITSGVLLATLDETSFDIPNFDDASAQTAKAPANKPHVSALTPHSFSTLPIDADEKEAVSETDTAVKVAFTSNTETSCETLVLGGGPGGYTAAFRAADLGQKVTLVERYPTLGGVCLNVGCIPSKSLLHAAKVITDAEEMAAHGIQMGKPEIDLKALRGWKNGVIKRLTSGLNSLSKAREIDVIQGVGFFTSPHTLVVETDDGTRTIRFEKAIIAAGSSAIHIPGFPHGHLTLIDSTGALQLRKIPERMLVIGGGIIGLEMACIYDALGAKVTIAEGGNDLIAAADRDLMRPLLRRITRRYDAIYTNTKVTKVEAQAEKLLATLEGEKAPKEPQLFDMVLMAVGRRPNGLNLSAERAGVHVDERGFITVDHEQRTNVPHIFAVGDICSEPMLAHKAMHEGKIAAEVIAGMHKTPHDTLIPSVAYTDPEIAWIGLTENDAKAQEITYKVSQFPWVASGRAKAISRDEGITKLLWSPDSKRVLGAGIVGTNAGELLAELGLAINMGATLDDIANTVHAHPSLSETSLFAAEVGLETITDLYIPKK